MTYDVIGDIHGHAEELRTLLRQLGYEERNGCYVAEGRNAIFVGDFIDRGPAIREVLQIARAMVSRNGAYAVLGNHEFNALCYHTPDGAGSFLRPHSTKNANQHQATVDQLVLPYPEEWRSYLRWFKDLPLFWRSTDCESFTLRGMKMRSAWSGVARFTIPTFWRPRRPEAHLNSPP